MAVKTSAELKEYFKTNKEPTEAQFADLIDSAVLKSDGIPFIPGGNIVGANTSIGLKGSYALDLITNNSSRIRLHANGRKGFGTTVDAGYDNDFAGTARFQGVVTYSNNQNRVEVLNTAGGYGMVLGRPAGTPANNSTYITMNDGALPATGINNTWIGAQMQGWGASAGSIVVGDSNRNFQSKLINNSIALGSGLLYAAAGNIDKCLLFASGAGSQVTTDLTGAIALNANPYSNVFSAGMVGRAVNTFAFGEGLYSNTPGMADRYITVTSQSEGNTDRNGGRLIVAGSRGTGLGTPGDIAFAIAVKNGGSDDQVQAWVNKWYMKGQTGQFSNVSAPNACALMQLDSTTQGFLGTRMTTAQRDTMVPVAGLEIFNTTLSKKQVYDGATWQSCW